MNQEPRSRDQGSGIMHQGPGIRDHEPGIMNHKHKMLCLLQLYIDHYNTRCCVLHNTPGIWPMNRDPGTMNQGSGFRVLQH